MFEKRKFILSPQPRLFRSYLKGSVNWGWRSELRAGVPDVPDVPVRLLRFQSSSRRAGKETFQEKLEAAAMLPG